MFIADFDFSFSLSKSQSLLGDHCQDRSRSKFDWQSDPNLEFCVGTKEFLQNIVFLFKNNPLPLNALNIIFFITCWFTERIRFISHICIHFVLEKKKFIQKKRRSFKRDMMHI